jgi:hypothetical protein
VSAQRLSAPLNELARPNEGLELGALNSLLSWDSNLYSFPEASLVPKASEFVQQLQQLTQSLGRCGGAVTVGLQSHSLRQGPLNGRPPYKPSGAYLLC